MAVKVHPRAKRSYHVNGSVYDELYDWKRERWGGLTMCGSEKENVKWTLLTVTMPLKLPEDKEVLWWCCWRASERANGRIERVARGQGHHCILRFTLCHQSAALPRSRRSFATYHFLFSATPPHYPSFSNSGIPISRAASCRCPLSWHLHSRISHHRPLNPLNGNISPLIECKSARWILFPMFSLENYNERHVF